jgi:hypothetical protein
VANQTVIAFTAFLLGVPTVLALFYLSGFVTAFNLVQEKFFLLHFGRRSAQVEYLLLGRVSLPLGALIARLQVFIE